LVRSSLTAPAPPAVSALSLHDALPISPRPLVMSVPICRRVVALLLASAWMSVFAAMKSTRSRFEAIIVLIALQPPPPTPTTRIFAAVFCSNASIKVPSTPRARAHPHVHPLAEGPSSTSGICRQVFATGLSHCPLGLIHW